MTRHTAIHEQASIAVKKPRKVSWYVLLSTIASPPLIKSYSRSCATLKVRCDGQPGSSCTRCLTSKQLCVYRNTEKISLSSHEPSLAFISPHSQAAVNSDATSQTAFDIPPSVPSINSSSSISTAYLTLDGDSGVPSPLRDSCKPTGSLCLSKRC